MSFSTPAEINIHGRYHQTSNSYTNSEIICEAGALLGCWGGGVLEILGRYPFSDPHTCLNGKVDGIHHRLAATLGASELTLSRTNVSAQAVQQFLIALDVQVIAGARDAIVMIFAAAVQPIAGSFSIASSVKQPAVSPIP